ncbi:MAG: outer membrane protein assembly factor BamA [Rhodospirillales bacterium]|jgi:outer membrane protein insertion porin family|nr:outer membrane protein assembly factor BamA [Rhodospirillales bacterium]
MVRGFLVSRALMLAVVLLVAAVAWRPALAQEAAAGDVVQSIVIEGLQRSSPESVRAYLLIQEGDPFDPGRIDRSLKSLFATGRFANVTIRREGNALIVTVVENPTINRVAFEGNSKIDDEALTSEVTLKPLGIYTRATVQSDVRRILELYRRSGRFAAAVEPKIIELPQNRVDVVFEINEGPVTGVERIQFVGNRHFSDSRLREEVRTRETRWWAFLATEDTYDPDRLALDRELLRRLYLNAGFADFRVESAVAELTPDRENFIVTFVVNEGERYKVGTISIESTLRGLEPAPLYDELTFSTGDWYSADQIEKSINALTDAVAERGFAFIDVRPKLERNREQRAIDIVFVVSEGPRVFVERIDISGNVRTIDRVIRREMRLAEGDAFNAAKLRRSRQRIQDLDFFEKVTVEETAGSTPDRTVVKVQVAEKSTGSLSIGAGFSTGAGFLGDFSIRERNLLGRGQDLRVALLLGQRQQQANLVFTEPYFMDREVSAGFNLFYVQTDRQSESSFDSRAYGLQLNAGYPFSETLSQSWSYTIKQQEIYNVPNDASIFVQEATGLETVSEIGQTLTYDRRDSRINPTKGYFARLTTDIAGLGGTVAYARPRVSSGYYYPIADNWVASLTGEVGRIFGLGEDVKLLDRFYIGGAEIRGFKTDGVGPRDKDTNDALGGEIFYATSAQLKFPLGLPEEFQISGRVFTDVGSSWKMANQRGLVDDSSNPRLSVGTGLTWLSPFGPLGVDIGYALIKEDFDQTELFRVNFGTQF